MNELLTQLSPLLLCIIIALVSIIINQSITIHFNNKLQAVYKKSYEGMKELALERSKINQMYETAFGKPNKFTKVKIDPNQSSVPFDPKFDQLGFENRVKGSGYDIEQNTDYSFEEDLPKGYKRIVACHDQGKDKWQCVGITEWCLVDNKI
jgi:lipopolysaccharide export LptBFGC system permease protein LptF